jgi:hypothetical protein
MAGSADYKMLVDRHEKGWWEYPVFVTFAQYLRSRGLPVTIEEVDSFALRLRFSRPEFGMRHWGAIIQHCDSGKFWMLDCSDWVTPFDINIREIARDFRCQGILKCQYRRQPYQGGHLEKIRPWTYFEQHAPEFQSRIERLRAMPRTKPSLFFRGNSALEGREAILRELNRGQIMNGSTGSIRYIPYLEEMAQHWVALALPGMGNICHREIECFGSGTPVLMPTLKNTLHDPLVPDFHYISVDADTLADKAELVAERILKRFHEIAGRRDYLDFVARNAMAWYDTNVRFPASLDLAVELMGLSGLRQIN